MRSNAWELQRDAVMQQTLVGLDEQISAHAAPEQQELIDLTEELIERARRAGTIRADATAWDIAMLMCGLCATMTRSAPGFDSDRYLELTIDSLRAH